MEKKSKPNRCKPIPNWKAFSHWFWFDLGWFLGAKSGVGDEGSPYILGPAWERRMTFLDYFSCLRSARSHEKSSRGAPDRPQHTLGHPRTCVWHPKRPPKPSQDNSRTRQTAKNTPKTPPRRLRGAPRTLPTPQGVPLGNPQDARGHPPRKPPSFDFGIF